MGNSSPTKTTHTTRIIAICGNPNCGKTTIFNGVTGLNQQVGNYPGVTVERVSGQFRVGDNTHTLVDIPGTYSLSAFSPDEYIACSALTGGVCGQEPPDAIICVLDATNLERGLYFLNQVLEIGKPVVVAINMIDVAARRGLEIDYEQFSAALGGLPVVPLVGSRGTGIPELKKAAAGLFDQAPAKPLGVYDDATEKLIEELRAVPGNGHRSRAEYLRIIFDVDGPAEAEFHRHAPATAASILEQGRKRIKESTGGLGTAETARLTSWASKIYNRAVETVSEKPSTISERIDRYLLHPVLGPIVLILTMILVFQSIFSWAEPFMTMIDSLFGSLAAAAGGMLDDGPVRSLITDGIIGGVGSVLVFVPQIIILFLFISVLEDSGYMARAAFLVDRMFRWCGLSGKSFIPMLSSFACAVPGILATRTIEDRKLRFITIMVAPLMTCSARLPVYAIMIAAFIPYQTYFGLFNLQGIVLTMLYLLGIVAAVVVSYVLQKLVFKAERGTFFMEMPSYKVPTARSVVIRVLNRVKAFVLRAGTVIMAITIIIWALSYFPRSAAVIEEYGGLTAAVESRYDAETTPFESELATVRGGLDVAGINTLKSIGGGFEAARELSELDAVRETTGDVAPELAPAVTALYEMRRINLAREAELADLANRQAGAQLRSSYFAHIGHALQPLFEPLGWDWRITMATMSAFPAREVIIATVGTIFNLGSDVDDGSTSLIEKMRQAKWEDGPRVGESLFTPSVALSIMIFFALCCQCGATLVTIKKETASWGYPVVVFSYMTVLAYVTALGAYQLFSRVWY